MTKGEEIALAAFPPIIVGEGKTRYDANELPRGIFLQGYETGRNGWVTWEDVRLFVRITSEVRDEFDGVDYEEAFYEKYPTEKAFYEEVMQRFINRRILKH